MKRWILIMCCCILALDFLIFSGCKENSGLENGGKITIAVTIIPEETFVRAVCGDLVEIVTMIPAGFNPESHEPTARQMERFSDAFLYFTIGVASEQSYILPNAGDVRIVSLRDKAAAKYPERFFESGERDPHIWLSPKRAAVMVAAIADEMCKLDPVHGETYINNSNAYVKKLNELDELLKTAFKRMKDKKIIVYHPAFGYLAEDYGFEMYAIEEEGKEATMSHLQKMIDFAKRENIKVIFYQEEIDSSQSAAFAEEIGGKSVKLSPLAPDYIENLQTMADAITAAMDLQTSR